MNPLVDLLTNTSFLYWASVIVYAITIFSVIGVILSENRNPVKSLAWVTVLLLFPAVGLVLYFFFGRSFKHIHMISRRNKRRLRRNEKSLNIDYSSISLTAESLQQIKLAHSLSGALYYPDNNVEIFTSGSEKFEALKRDLNDAQQYIHLQYYIFEDDETGKQIRDILIERAKAGVRVRVIYDHVGSFRTKKRFFKEMQNAGIMVYPFFRVAFPPFATRINWRNHRKICVIDGKIGYIGGMNIADRYIKGVPYGVWRDTHLRITGPAINSLQYSFAVDWNFMGQPLPNENTEPTTPANNEHAGMQMVTSGPTNRWNDIALVYLKAIANAKKSILIQTPYFLPTESLLRALISAALSKVEVRIMIPRQSDSSMLRYASFSYIRECLRAGIKIYLYDAGMLHSKTLTIDDEFSSVGSTNFDFRSFEHNFECNMFIYSKDVNKRMREIFAQDLKECSRISPAKWDKRPGIEKAKESIIRLLSPIL